MVEFLALITPLVALAASLSVIYAIRFLDVVEREPKRLIALAMLLGAISVLPAIIWQLTSESVWQWFGADEDVVDHITTVIDAPISEELFKGLAELSYQGPGTMPDNVSELLTRAQLDNARDVYKLIESRSELNPY